MTAHTETELDGGSTLRWFLALTQFLLILDIAILNVAVPVIGTDLSLTPAGETWVLNAYIVAFGGVLLLTGSVADAVGQGRVLVTGLTVLAIGAGFGALGQTGEVVIASRAVQGIGAAMAAASAMALVFSRFNGPARRKTLGLFASMAGLGGATGTALSGVLTETFGWRSAFWLNVAAAAALAIWACTLPNTFAQGRRRKLNILGGILITAALASTAYAITSTSEMGLNEHVTIAGLIAVITFVAFVLLERRVANPLISPTIWRIPPLLRGLLLAGTGQWVLVPIFLFISLYLQRVLGYEPLAAGMSLLPMSVAILFVAPFVPRAVGRWGVYEVMGSAFVIVALAGAWLSLVSPEGSFFTDILGPTLLLALGLPTISVTTNVVTAENSPANEPGVTSGLLTTSQQFGATLGLAAWVAIASVGPDPDPQTLADGYARAFLVSAVVMILAAVAALWASSLGPSAEPDTPSGSPAITPLPQPGHTSRHSRYSKTSGRPAR